MVCAFQEEVAPQVLAGIQQGSSPADVLWTAESLAPLLGPQQSMSNQFAMHFTGNRASSGTPITGTIPGLASFNGKHLLRLSHMIAAAAAAVVLTHLCTCLQSSCHSPFSLCKAQTIVGFCILRSESTQANVCLAQVRQNSTPAAAT